MRAAIYCRISEDREGAGLGVERQRSDCEELARKRNWNMVGTYVDNDVSAYSNKKRPEYRRLLADVQAGAVDAIVAWHTDRLHRSPRELEEFIDVCERHKVTVETVRAGELDLKTPAGRAVARTLGAWARYESEHKSERIRRKWTELAQRGMPMKGGLRCYGYAKDKVTVVPDEAAVLTDCAERVLAGESLNSICSDLNGRGIATSTGRAWTALALKDLLVNPRMAGLVVHHTAGRVRAQWPSIFTEGQHTRLVALLTDPARRTRRGAPRRHLLSGILRCGECGQRMFGKYKHGARGRRVLMYQCPDQQGKGCGRVAISAHLVEPYVVDAVLVTLERLRLSPDGERSEDGAGEIEALTSDRSHLEELAALYGSRAITAAEWLRARAEIEERIAERNRRIAEQASHGPLHDFLRRDVALADAWSTLATDHKRSILGAVLDRVTVARARLAHRHFDPSRLTPVWRV